MRFIALVSALALVGCGPSCEEQGGRLVFSHFQPVLMGKTMGAMPIYVCKVSQ
ncbi:MAG TPA: hypothetical protein VMS38_02235 [Pseudorhodoferax sp.]|nr:hypothetical protein [Pseudorhodoferax sp.]